MQSSCRGAGGECSHKLHYILMQSDFKYLQGDIIDIKQTFANITKTIKKNPKMKAQQQHVSSHARPACNLLSRLHSMVIVSSAHTYWLTFDWSFLFFWEKEQRQTCCIRKNNSEWEMLTELFGTIVNPYTKQLFCTLLYSQPEHFKPILMLLESNRIIL